MSIKESNKVWASGGAHESLVTIGDPRLRSETVKVADFASISETIEFMIRLLRDLNGAGLAAPQVGIFQKIVIVEVRKTDLFPNRPESPLYIMVNPKIVESSENQEDGWEGCFSVPGIMAKVIRPTEIKVDYFDEDGNNHFRRFDGYVARVIQHEIDHLNGVIFIDKVTNTRTYSTVTNWVKYHANQ